jgi:hypothetical protein
VKTERGKFAANVVCSALVMSTFKRGDIVQADGLLAVVVGTPEDSGAPEDHLALWYGEPQCTRISQGGTGGHCPEVWIVPAEDCTLAARVVRH